MQLLTHALNTMLVNLLYWLNRKPCFIYLPIYKMAIFPDDKVVQVLKNGIHLVLKIFIHTISYATNYSIHPHATKRQEMYNCNIITAVLTKAYIYISYISYTLLLPVHIFTTNLINVLEKHHGLIYLQFTELRKVIPTCMAGHTWLPRGFKGSHLPLFSPHSQPAWRPHAGLFCHWLVIASLSNVISTYETLIHFAMYQHKASAWYDIIWFPVQCGSCDQVPKFYKYLFISLFYFSLVM